jgi:HPr kinase/phosphorylase
MLLHASTVAIAGRAVLLVGPPGSGKSDLALRLIDSGALLVADDQTMLQRDKDILTASPPASIAGKIEIRQLGLVEMPYIASVPVALYIDLAGEDEKLDRLPEESQVFLLDYGVRRLRLHAFHASTPAKIRAALQYQRCDD